MHCPLHAAREDFVYAKNTASLWKALLQDMFWMEARYWEVKKPYRKWNCRLQRENSQQASGLLGNTSISHEESRPDRCKRSFIYSHLKTVWSPATAQPSEPAGWFVWAAPFWRFHGCQSGLASRRSGWAWKDRVIDCGIDVVKQHRSRRQR